ncbi:hypothetical protein AGABI2DRAFT_194604 [Agaricus bisporus var. bisporus H97]|uniref:hypothetical protein n=1 Tax=Agaricus bisporus var. bisporus (strain H97 / ATCC MYA-4626 / FGSC 10389) TaxID=936046 RepID=UPI00029F68C3|nr:hypothetical protein AGABI2DRAFT_194604 [Agaricus bisporus var. bisporus H97]EKV44656.1 hypothetical protein AGABI2DRAFT_194604 [Agaricus bisporus var. bisporus H97]
MPTVLGPNMSQPYPKLHHAVLDTTFVGVNHAVSTSDTLVHQYRGIKYASVPARFRQSKIFNSYPSLTDASKHGPICPQSGGSTPIEEVLLNLKVADVPRQTFKHDEFECLNLNITCPAGLTVHSQLPVMVWVHGGGDRGSGNSWVYDGGALVRKSMEIGKPMIFVSINFRIGLLGFACCPAIFEDNKSAGDIGAGNYGLRDQRTAFEWIQRHIEGFGGDPKNITLFGESSGAMDIVYHLLSSANETKPMFTRAIIQSAIFEPYLPDVASAGWHLSRFMSALQASTIEELRVADVKTLVSVPCMHRAIDDGVFFRKGWTEFFDLEENTRRPREKEKYHLRDLVHRGPSRSRSRLRELYSPSRNPRLSTPKVQPPHILQPIIIGDCCSDSLLWSLPISAWTGPTVVRRLKAITQSIHKSNTVLHAFEISSCTPDEEIMDRVLDLVNDARVAWPTEILANSAKRERGGHNVWRYVFDQEGPSRGVPHHAADIVYLFDNLPLPKLKGPATQEESFDEGHFDDVDDGDSDETRCNEYESGSECEDIEWDVCVVGHYSYQRVKDAIQERWIAFAYGESPWSEDKVFVFGPEGETGERSECIFDGRRRRNLWKETFEPLGFQMVQKVGAELSRGP